MTIPDQWCLTPVASISCGSASVCWAAGDAARSFSTYLAVRVTDTVPGKGASAPCPTVGCVSRSTCLLAVGSQETGPSHVDELDNGKVMATATIKDFDYGGITCPTATTCLGAGPASFHAPTPTTTYFVGGVVTLGI